MQVEGLEWFEAKKFIDNFEETNVEADLLKGIHLDKQVDITLPFGYKTITEGNSILAQRARDYLTGRGFKMEVLDRLGIGYCDEHYQHANPEIQKKNDYFGYIIVPFKKRGKLYYYLGRDFIGNFLRYKNPPEELFGVGKSEIFFNEDALELYSTTFLTEGWTDALTIGKHGIASLGWSLSPIQKSKLLKSNCKNLVVIADKEFYKQAVRTAMDFIDNKAVYVVNFDNMPGKDANEVGREMVLEEVKRTPQLTATMAYSIIM